jgi:hypothetical protein
MMLTMKSCSCAVLVFVAHYMTEFAVGAFHASRRQAEAPFQSTVGRKSFFEGLVATAIAPLVILPDKVTASGGATAGGVYLLSAKQRYNDRVQAGVKGYISLGLAIKNGDKGGISRYFSGEDTGTWKDLSVAGYLLANAFRRNSSAAPDSLPSVKVCSTWYASLNLFISLLTAI